MKKLPLKTLFLLVFYSAVFSSLSSCKTTKNSLATPGHRNPGIEESLHLVIVSTNDIHGSIRPAQSTTEYESGGLILWSGFHEAAKKAYSGKTIWLDGGDLIQGSLESNSFQGKPLIEYLNQNGAVAMAAGNHEFDFGKENIKSLSEFANFPILSVNIFNKKNSKTYFQGSKLIEKNGMKIGLIGATTQETAYLSLAKRIEDLEFRNPVPLIVSESKALRAKGAQIVILLAHAGVTCNTPSKKIRGEIPVTSIKSYSTIQTGCDTKGELYQWLNKIPLGTLDAVVSGHSHSVVHHWIEGVPVVQSGSMGRVFQLIHLYLNPKTKKVKPEWTEIEGPFGVCSNYVENTLNCIPSKDKSLSSVDWEPATFHGNNVKPSFSTQRFFEPLLDKLKEKREEKLTTAKDSFEYKKDDYSTLGHQLALSIRREISKDWGDVIVFLTSDSIRNSWDKGKVTYGKLVETFPYENTLMILKMKGSELKKFTRTALLEKQGVYKYSGLQVELINRVSLQGKVKDPFIHFQKEDLATGEIHEIDPDNEYLVGIPDYLVHGGDGFGNYFSQFPKQKWLPTPDASFGMQKLIVQDLKKQESIRTDDLKQNLKILSPEDSLVYLKSKRHASKKAPRSTRSRRAKK